MQHIINNIAHSNYKQWKWQISNNPVNCCIIQYQYKVSNTSKCNKYSNDYHRYKAEICTVSNIIKYDMQN